MSCNLTAATFYDIFSCHISWDSLDIRSLPVIELSPMSPLICFPSCVSASLGCSGRILGWLPFMCPPSVFSSVSHHVSPSLLFFIPRTVRRVGFQQLRRSGFGLGCSAGCPSTLSPSLCWVAVVGFAAGSRNLSNMGNNHPKVVKVVLLKGLSWVSTLVYPAWRFDCQWPPKQPSSSTWGWRWCCLSWTTSWAVAARRGWSKQPGSLWFT